MKFVALILILSLFFVSALDQQQVVDPASKEASDAVDESVEDLEDQYAEAADALDRAKKNRDLGYSYYNYGGSSRRYSYNYGSNYVHPVRQYPVYVEPVVVNRYHYNTYRGGSKGMGMGYYRKKQ
jgi:hypothetical protein